MIREPAVEIINLIKNLDASKPAYRFILCELGRYLYLTSIAKNSF
jgi:hypothetical protein